MAASPPWKTALSGYDINLRVGFVTVFGLRVIVLITSPEIIIPATSTFTKMAWASANKSTLRGVVGEKRFAVVAYRGVIS